MFKTKTVIILGAGASKNLGFPDGEELIQAIIRSNYTSQDHNENFKIGKLRRLLKEMQPLSIDMFLSYHTEFEEIGKILIAEVILKHENKNTFHIKKRDKREQWNWFPFLIDSIISQCQKPKDILENNKNLTIVTFNYDLSLEYFLYTRLKEISFFSECVDELLEDLQIIHVYGQLGCFQWHCDFYKKTYDQHPILRDNNSYGSESVSSEYAKGIQIIGMRKWNNGVNNRLPKHIELIRSTIINAKNLYVLGFGFYEPNMDLIGLRQFIKSKDETMPKKKFYYTNYKDKQKIERQLNKFGRRETGTGPTLFIKSTKIAFDALCDDFDLGVFCISPRKGIFHFPIGCQR